MTSKLDELISELCPNGVEYKKIGDIATLVTGGTPKTSYAEYWEGGNIPWMASGEVNLGIVSKTEKKITEAGYNSSNTKMLPANTVVIALAGQGKTRGKVALTKIPLCTNQSLCGICVDYTVNSKFLYHFLSSKYIELRAISSGDGTRGGLNLRIISNFEIPVPPLEVQAEIVRILDTFTELTADLTAELTARKKQYEYYRDALLTFDDNNPLHSLISRYCPNGVDKIKLNEICKIYDGTHSTPQYKESGVKFVSVENINDLYSTTKYISEEDFDKYKIKPQIGDVFMTRIGSIGICNVVDRDEKLAYYVSLALLRPNTAIINSRYLKYAIESIHGRKELRKRTLVNSVPIKINKDDIGKVQLPVPPLEVQHQIVQILDRFDALCNDLTQGLPAEIEARRKQYEYYRDQLLTFKRA